MFWTWTACVLGGFILWGLGLSFFFGIFCGLNWNDEYALVMSIFWPVTVPVWISVLLIKLAWRLIIVIPCGWLKLASIGLTNLGSKFVKK